MHHVMSKKVNNIADIRVGTEYEIHDAYHLVRKRLDSCLPEDYPLYGLILPVFASIVLLTKHRKDLPQQLDDVALWFGDWNGSAWCDARQVLLYFWNSSLEPLPGYAHNTNLALLFRTCGHTLKSYVYEQDEIGNNQLISNTDAEKVVDYLVAVWCTRNAVAAGM